MSSEAENLLPPLRNAELVAADDVLDLLYDLTPPSRHKVLRYVALWLEQHPVSRPLNPEPRTLNP